VHLLPLPYKSTEEDNTAPPPPAEAAAVARQTGAVKKIMSKIISLQSTNKYAGQNTTFAIFCCHSDKLRKVWCKPGLPKNS